MKLSPVLLSLAVLVAAQTPGQAGWREFAVEGHRAQKAKQDDKAISLWTKALAEAEQLGKEHPWYSVSLRNLGVLYFNSNAPDSLDKAREYFVRERDALKALGTNYEDQAFGLQYLARIDALQGQYESSVTNYLNALRLSEKYGSPQPQSLLEVQVPLLMTRREDESQRIREQLRNIVARAYPDPVRQAGEYLKLTEKLETDAARLTDKNKSAPYYQVCALALTDALKLVPGTGDDQTLLERGLVLLRRSRDLRMQDKYKDACIDARNALAVLQKTNARKPMIDAMREAACNINALGRPNEAVSLTNQAITLSEKMVPRPEADIEALKKELQAYTAGGAQAKPQI